MLRLEWLHATQVKTPTQRPADMLVTLLTAQAMQPPVHAYRATALHEQVQSDCRPSLR